jgi:hypothetical protein
MNSKSRKVNGYVKAVLRYRKLQAKLDLKMAALNPLEAQTAHAKNDATARYGMLNGGQLAEANRMLGAS